MLQHSFATCWWLFSGVGNVLVISQHFHWTSVHVLSKSPSLPHSCWQSGKAGTKEQMTEFSFQPRRWYNQKQLKDVDGAVWGLMDCSFPLGIPFSSINIYDCTLSCYKVRVAQGVSINANKSSVCKHEQISVTVLGILCQIQLKRKTARDRNYFRAELLLEGHQKAVGPWVMSPPSFRPWVRQGCLCSVCSHLGIINPNWIICFFEMINSQILVGSLIPPTANL